MRVYALVAMSFLVVAPLARAQSLTLPTDATLSRLIDESLAARPELAKAEAVVRAAQERVLQAGAFPDPMLSVGIQNDGFTSIEIGHMENSYVSLMASQTLPWLGKRGLRRDIAQLGAAQATKPVARLRLATEALVRRAYLDLVLARDRLALLDQLDAIWQKSFGIARARYEAGDGAQSDVLRAQLEQQRLKQRRFSLFAEAQSRVQTLNRLRDHPLNEPIHTTSHIRELPIPARLEGLFSEENALSRSPELASARLDIARANTSVALAHKSYYPDVTMSAGVMPRGGDFPPMWLVTVGGTLPVFADRKQTRAVAENRALATAAQKEAETIVQVLRLRGEERRTALGALVETIDLYKEGLLVQSEATTESTLAQYKVGRVTFASVLEANAGFIADQEGYLESIAAAHRILISDAEVSLAPVSMPAGGRGSLAIMPGVGASSIMETTGGTVTSVVGASAASGSSMSGM